jgi:uncharacterized protein YhbP (UPF0306 family)
MREEADFEVVSGCSEGFVSKTMIVTCEWCLRRDIEVWIQSSFTVADITTWRVIGNSLTITKKTVQKLSVIVLTIYGQIKQE